MATTTNFGWETPDDTDLVKDGAASIRTLGSAIDTSLVDLKGGTTGQVLSKASNTDMDFTWVAQDDSNAIQNAIVDAKGDLITATAADTPSRIAVGTNGQVLTADSTTATGLKWADSSSGSMTLISTTSMSGASITLSSIPQTYNDLRIIIRNFKPALDSDALSMRFNADATANRHRNIGYTTTGNPVTFGQTEVTIVTASDDTADNGIVFAEIYDYANTTTWKLGNVLSVVNDYTTTTSLFWTKNILFYNQTSAISSLSFLSNAGNLGSGTIYLYGVK